MADGVMVAGLLPGRTLSDRDYLAARDAFGFERMQRNVTELGR